VSLSAIRAWRLRMTRSANVASPSARRRR